MPETISVCKRAFKLYNRVGATDFDKLQAMQLLQNAPMNEIDDYGKFLQAEIIFWKRNSTLQEREAAFDTFRKMSCDGNLPTPLIVGACFYAARCYELGFAAKHDFEAALICYRKANQINSKACVKDIARVQNAINNADKKVGTTATPDKYKYCDGIEAGDEYEYLDAISEWAKDFEKCITSLRDNKFFYEDDPDEISVDDLKIYDVDDDE